ncbi:MAG: hypothetical protein IRY94_10815 [Rhodospirillaceae bacterium]|nr:hypothetical protein [Rhodospirillaceae bacterium]
MKAIETISARCRRGLPPCPKFARRIVAGAVVAAALLAGLSGRADEPPTPGLDRPSVVAPFRFSPAPPPGSPLEDQKAQQYRNQLQQRVFDLDRSDGRLGPLQDEELRRARGELDRMNQILLPRR